MLKLIWIGCSLSLSMNYEIKGFLPVPNVTPKNRTTLIDYDSPAGVAIIHRIFIVLLRRTAVGDGSECRFGRV